MLYCHSSTVDAQSRLHLNSLKKNQTFNYNSKISFGGAKFFPEVYDILSVYKDIEKTAAQDNTFDNDKAILKLESLYEKGLTEEAQKLRDKIFCHNIRLIIQLFFKHKYDRSCDAAYLQSLASKLLETIEYIAKKHLYNEANGNIAGYLKQALINSSIGIKNIRSLPVDKIARKIIKNNVDIAKMTETELQDYIDQCRKEFDIKINIRTKSLRSAINRANLYTQHRRLYYIGNDKDIEIPLPVYDNVQQNMDNESILQKIYQIVENNFSELDKKIFYNVSEIAPKNTHSTPMMTNSMDNIFSQVGRLLNIPPQRVMANYNLLIQKIQDFLNINVTQNYNFSDKQNIILQIHPPLYNAIYFYRNGIIPTTEVKNRLKDKTHDYTQITFLDKPLSCEATGKILNLTKARVQQVDAIIQKTYLLSMDELQELLGNKTKTPESKKFITCFLTPQEKVVYYLRCGIIPNEKELAEELSGVNKKIFSHVARGETKISQLVSLGEETIHKLYQLFEMLESIPLAERKNALENNSIDEFRKNLDKKLHKKIELQQIKMKNKKENPEIYRSFLLSLLDPMGKQVYFLIKGLVPKEAEKEIFFSNTEIFCPNMPFSTTPLGYQQASSLLNTNIYNIRKRVNQIRELEKLSLEELKQLVKDSEHK